jgi:hypothetical protein
MHRLATPGTVLRGHHPLIAHEWTPAVPPCSPLVNLTLRNRQVRDVAVTVGRDVDRARLLAGPADDLADGQSGVPGCGPRVGELGLQHDEVPVKAPRLTLTG